MTDVMDELRALLLAAYTPAEADRWLGAKHPLLEGRRPEDILMAASLCSPPGRTRCPICRDRVARVLQVAAQLVGGAAI